MKNKNNAEEILLSKLVTDPTFLRTAITEQAITDATLGEKRYKSSVREAVIGLVHSQYLERTPPEGVRRHHLEVNNLAELHGILLKFEHIALSNIFKQGSMNRTSSAGKLRYFLRQQKEAQEAGDVYRWVKADIGFHTALLDDMWSPELAKIVERTAWITRIGSAMSETPEQRNAITDLNEKLVHMISRGNLADAVDIMEQRLKISLANAIEGLGLKSSEFHSELWENAKGLFAEGVSKPSPARG